MLLWLAFNADENGYYERTISDLARELKIQRRCVQRSLDQLLYYKEVKYNQHRSNRSGRLLRRFEILLRPEAVAKAA
ncbi:hypothetical protein PUV54_16570 [Hyphococcus flavus]|nr:hypothetical protein [Hyphococcus flavus]WDI31566.1 hypothetical protein PUV54_16565 [Hyphococcus flavus]WDI31567.1 hypothetical protein PUV54_16570 [Hyphococcus flavus]